MMELPEWLPEELDRFRSDTHARALIGTQEGLDQLLARHEAGAPGADPLDSRAGRSA